MQSSPETSFQRANRLADEAKARNRREYQERGPLPPETWVDYDIELVAVLVPVNGWQLGDRRSTRKQRVYQHLYVTKRPTENAAFKRARGEDQLLHIEVVRQEPGVEHRYCLGCKTRHAVTEFDWDKKRTPPGYHWYCRSWLRKHGSRTFKRAA